MNRRIFCLGLGATATGLLIAGCSSADSDDETADSEVDVAAASEADDIPSDDEASEDADDEDAVELPDDFEPFETPELNLETLQAEFPDGPVDAEAYRNTWVGEVTDEL
jgi:hypothetical protein